MSIEDISQQCIDYCLVIISNSNYLIVINPCYLLDMHNSLDKFKIYVGITIIILGGQHLMANYWGCKVSNCFKVINTLQLIIVLKKLFGETQFTILCVIILVKKY